MSKTNLIGIFKGLLYFTAGAAVGAGASYVVLQKKFDKMYEEGLASVREAYGRTKTTDCTDDSEKKTEPIAKPEEKKKTTMTSQSPVVKAPDKKDRVDYNRMVDGTGYISSEEKKEKEKGPYIISPDEIGEKDYDIHCLYYFEDGVLTDDYYDPVEDIENTVGLDFPNHFGEYESDTVFVRNDVKQEDYEITLDGRNFSEVEKV